MKKKRDDADIKIKRAALELLQEKGLKRTRMIDIARRAGVNEATLFRHYKTKDEFFASLMKETLARRAEEVDLSIEPSNDIIADLTQIGVTLNNLMVSNAKIMKLKMIEGPKAGSEAQKIVDNQVDKILASLSRYFAKSIDAGLIRKVDAHLAAVAFYNFFYRHMMVTGFENRDPLFRADRTSIRRFVILFVYGIGKQGEPPC
jgi:AcrR family transcriptional regulator